MGAMQENPPLGVWECQIGSGPANVMPGGWDQPMRDAIREAYRRITGEEPSFIFSGWRARLSEERRDALTEDERLQYEEHRAKIAAAFPHSTRGF